MGKSTLFEMDLLLGKAVLSRFPGGNMADRQIIIFFFSFSRVHLCFFFPPSTYVHNIHRYQQRNLYSQARRRDCADVDTVSARRSEENEGGCLSINSVFFLSFSFLGIALFVFILILFEE